MYGLTIILENITNTPVDTVVPLHYWFLAKKAAISLYVSTGDEGRGRTLVKLENTRWQACIYIKKPAIIDERVLTELMQSTIERVSENIPWIQ